MSFEVVSRRDSPFKSVVLRRDGIQIGLAENGGDPTQEGCFFEVDNAEAAFAELKSNGLEKEEAGFRIDQYGDTSYKAFFVVAPDGLCYFPSGYLRLVLSGLSSRVWPRFYGTSLRHFGPLPTFTTFVTNVTLELPTRPVTSQHPGVGKIM